MDNHTNLDYTDPVPPPSPTTRLEPSRPAPAEDPVFNLRDVLLIILVIIGSLVLCIRVGMIIAAARYPLRADFNQLAENVWFILPVQLASYALTVGFMAFLVWHKYRAKLLNAVSWNLPSTQGVVAAFAAGACVGLGTQLLSGLLDRWIPKNLPIQQYFKTPSAAYAMVAFGILIAPVVEELFFRGFLYPALARPLGTGISMVLTAGGFALIHSEQLANSWAPLLLLFTVGMILTAVRARTKSVAVCVLMHMGYNSTLFAIAYIVTQGFRHMERG